MRCFMEAIDEAIGRIKDSQSVAVITGAGISQESGVPTFRGEEGLWKTYRAEDLANPAAFQRDPQLVWGWYNWRRGIVAEARPNPAHLGLVEMEENLDSFMIATQNVDGLHRLAGSKEVHEIHGNIWKARCTACETVFDDREVYEDGQMPHCPKCGALARPHILWFGETYDQELLSGVMGFLARSRTVLVIGTSGMVYMPVHLAEYAKSRGATIIDINPEDSAVTDVATISIRKKAGEAVSMIVKGLYH